jgi:hypothetical protein
MWMRATRWMIAALLGSAMTTVGCAAPTEGEPQLRAPVPIVDDEGLVHAFDTSIEMRLLDRIARDHVLHDREINVRLIDGIVSITGEVRTPLEKDRVGDLVRQVAGGIDVANQLDVRAPW